MDSLPKCLDHPLNWNKSEILAAPTAKSGLKRFPSLSAAATPP
jgi:hypothetical protein